MIDHRPDNFGGYQVIGVPFFGNLEILYFHKF